MSVTITCTPTSPIGATDFARIDVAGADQSTLTGYDGTEVSTMPGTPVQYPASPELRYYLTFELAGVVRGKSPVFSTNDEGAWTFDNYVFPEAGSWTVRLSNAATDASVETQAVTVQ
jgi:hypothetical protein